MAGKLKRGEKVPEFHITKAMKSMAKMPMNKLKDFMTMKESMTIEQKRKLLIGLRNLREQYTGNVGGETDIEADGNMLVSEEEGKNVVAKTFDTNGDFDSYVAQNRGIEITGKEQQAILGFKDLKPTQQTKFFIKYESADEFGNNTTLVIKKQREGNQFCWTAFSKNESAQEKPEPVGAMAEQDATGMDTDDMTVEDPIRISKSITFSDDMAGSEILGDFLRQLDLS
jgi:hypothetical protein